MNKAKNRKQLTKEILEFAFPVLLASISSEIYSATNSAIAGNTISDVALSAISACDWISKVFTFLFYGLGMGAGIIVARYFGAKDKNKLKKALGTSIVFSVVGGIFLTVASELLLPLLMKWCNISSELYPYSKQYLRIYLIGNTALFAYQMCFFIMRSFGDSRHPLYYQVLSLFTNAILGLTFSKVFHLGISGVAIATITSQYLVAFLSLKLILNLNQDLKFNIKEINFSWDMVKTICRLGIPAGLQNMLIAISSMVVHSYINEFENEIVAGIGAAEKVAVWGQICSSALSSASMNIISQSMGAEDYKKAKDSIRICVQLTAISAAVSMAVIMIFAPFWVSLFTSNATIIAYATQALRFMAPGYLLLSFSHIYNGACRGAGNVNVPMIIAVFGQVVCKYLFVVIGLQIVYDIHILYCATPFGFSVAGILAILYFNFGRWSKEHQLR